MKWLAAVIMVLAVHDAARAQAVSPPSERWYACTLGAEPCGWMKSQSTIGYSTTTHETSIKLIFRRGSTEVATAIETTLVEGFDGTVREMLITRTSGGHDTVERWRFLTTGIQRILKTAASTRTEVIPTPAGDWFSSEEALRRARAAKGEPSATEPTFACRVLDLSLGNEPVATTYFYEGREPVETTLGRIECTRWRLETDLAPPTALWLDLSGQLVASRAELGGGLGALAIVLSTRALAIPRGQAPEIMIRSAVRPTMADGVPRALDRSSTLRARVRRADGSPVVLPSIGAQRVGEDGIVVVDVGRGSPEADEIDGAFLRSVPMADTDDEELQAFARRGAGHKVGPAVRAEALRRAVNRHVNHKNLSTAFASASQTVRERTGDCTEHAVLLAAALRCDGIPSRVVNGLVWTRRLSPGEPPAYVWHMWTQALIDGEWWDLDATLSATRPYHAAHLAVSANDLSRSSISKTASEMLELMGNLEIEILQADTSRR